MCVSDKKSKIIGRSHLHDAVVMADEAPNARAYFEREHFVVATIATVPTDTTKWQENRHNYRMNRNKYGFFGGRFKFGIHRRRYVNNRTFVDSRQTDRKRRKLKVSEFTKAVGACDCCGWFSSRLPFSCAYKIDFPSTKGQWDHFPLTKGELNMKQKFLPNWNDLQRTDNG